MAIWIVKNSGKISYGIKRYLCDTLEDLPYSENGEVVIPGSKAYVISEKKTYMMGSDEEWHEIDEGSGGASSMSQLTDVDLTNLEDGQVLKYDEDTQTWKPGDDASATSLGNLDDVDLTGLQNGQVIIYDSTTEKWLASDIPSDIAELTQEQYDALPSGTKNLPIIYQISDRGYFFYKGKKFHEIKEMTMAEYDQLSPAEQNNGVEYFITDAPEIVTEITLADYEELTTEEQNNGTIYQIIDCGYFFYKGNRFMASLELTLAEYNNLTLEEQMNGTEYFITDAPEVVTDLAQVEYDALTTEQKNNGSIYQISDKGYCYYKQKQFRATKELTQAQYDALTPEQKADGTIYMISDATNNLSDFDDVNITSLTDGDVLTYDANANEWVNSPIPYFDIDMSDVEEGQIIQYSSKVNAFISAELKNTIGELYNESTGTLDAPNDLNYYLRYKAQHPIFNLAVSDGSNIRSVPAAICAHYLSRTGASGDVTALMDSYAEDSSVIADPTIKFYIDCYFMRDPSTMKKLVLSLSVANPTMTVESYTTVTDIFS